MKIFILHATAGEGHRRAALAVESALLRSGVAGEEVAVHDALDYGSAFFKKSYVGFYYWCVKNVPDVWGFLYHWLDDSVIYDLLYPIRRIYNAWHGRKLVAAVIAQNPALVICTHFFSAEVLGDAKKYGKIRAHLVVLVTDFHPARVWAHEGIDHYWVLSEEARQVLTSRGVTADKITAGGFPIMPEFQTRGSQSVMLEKHGLQPGKLTLLLTAGSFGLGEQVRLLKLLEAEKEKIQCMVVCGRNRVLQETLEKAPHSYPVKIFGFVNFMPELMDAADLIIAKPGGATTAEAMAKGVPMIATGAIPGQETENLKFLLKEKAVFYAHTPAEILAQVQAILKTPALLDEKRQVCDRLSNPRAADDIAQLRLNWIPAS